MPREQTTVVWGLACVREGIGVRRAAAFRDAPADGMPAGRVLAALANVPFSPARAAAGNATGSHGCRTRLSREATTKPRPVGRRAWNTCGGRDTIAVQSSRRYSVGSERS